MKEFIGRVIRAAGYEIHHKSAGTADPFQQQKLLLAGVAAPVIFDVGANTGEIAEKYRQIFRGANIYAFEPFPDVFAQLEERFRADKGIIAQNVALGSQSKNTVLRVNAASVTNSLLETEDTASSFWGKGLLETTSTVAVEVETVDQFCGKNQLGSIDVLKIDTQGTELEVLRGAAGMLAKGLIRVIYTEIIVVPTYKGQYKPHEMMGFLDGFGYSLLGLYNLWSKADGHLLQMDAIFVKSEMSHRDAPSEARVSVHE